MALTFDVPAGAVDPARMAAIIVEARQQTVLRPPWLHLLPVLCGVGAVLMAVLGQWFVAAVFAAGATVVLAAPALGRRQVAAAIRRQPSLVDAHTLVLDERGSTFTGTGVESSVDWPRYRRAFDAGDHLALQEDTDAVLLVPWSALVEPVPPEEALSRIRSWMT